MREPEPPKTFERSDPEPSAAIGGRADLPPAAIRALREAEERRKAAREAESGKPEIGGRGGLDPVRYGDWEVKGLTTDF